MNVPKWIVPEHKEKECFVMISASTQPLSIIDSTGGTIHPGVITDFVTFNISVAEESILKLEEQIEHFTLLIANVAGVHAWQVRILAAPVGRSRRLLAGLVLVVTIRVQSADDAERLVMSVREPSFNSHLRTAFADLNVIEGTVRHEHGYLPEDVMAVTRPIINVAGDDVTVVEASVSAQYRDAGATCFDLADGELSKRTETAGALYPSADRPGTYAIEYTCTNFRGFAAQRATRTVVVRDTECPVCIPLNGPSVLEASFPYLDQGAQCSDSLDGPISDVIVENNVDVERVGIYLVTYRARDRAGNWNDGDCKGSAQSIRTIHIVDTLQPVVSLRYKGSHLLSSSSRARGINGEQNPAAHTPLLATVVDTSTRVWVTAPVIAVLLGLVASMVAKTRRTPREYALDVAV
jgi:hypothetical protein